MKTNIKAFKALILKYESITEDDIYEANRRFSDKQILTHIATILTDFGWTQTCSLCKEAKNISENNNWVDIYHKYCIWTIYCRKNGLEHNYGCIGETLKDTWNAIYEHPENINHYKNRAKLMRKVLEDLGYKQPKLKLF